MAIKSEKEKLIMEPVIKEVDCVSDYINIINSISAEVENKYSNMDTAGYWIDKINEISKKINDMKNTKKTKKNYEEIETELGKFILGTRIYEDHLQLNKNTLILSYDIDTGTQFIEKDGFDVFYRGVYKHSYSLLPSVFRDDNYPMESHFYNFSTTTGYKFFSDNNTFNCLTTLQHYGCPTRLLDITKNPLVALYFACKDFSVKEIDPKNYGYVYVFLNRKRQLAYPDSDRIRIESNVTRLSEEEKLKLLNTCIKRIIDDGLKAKFDKSNNGPIVEKLYHFIKQDGDFRKDILCIDLLKTYFVQPNILFDRLDRQSGLFILSGLSSNISKAEEKINDLVFMKIKINNQKHILEELDRLNINESSLFPDLDHISNYIKERAKD